MIKVNIACMGSVTTAEIPKRFVATKVTSSKAWYCIWCPEHWRNNVHRGNERIKTTNWRRGRRVWTFASHWKNERHTFACWIWSMRQFSISWCRTATDTTTKRGTIGSYWLTTAKVSATQMWILSISWRRCINVVCKFLGYIFELA